MQVPFLNLKAQYLSIKDEIDEALKSVIQDNAFIRGEFVEEFEATFANAMGVKHCVSVANGTDALEIALRAFQVGPGDEVITVANSFIATSEAVTRVGASVVFVDCMPDTMSIDTCEIESKITKKTKAIIPVHLYGNPADMDEILEIAANHNLVVIEDSAQAHLADYKGRKTGTFGHAATFSFYPGKNLGAYGDAGAIVTNDYKIAKYARMYANHGRVGKYDHEFEGSNSRMDGLQGAILHVKLKYLKEWTTRRQGVAALYRKLLGGLDEVILPEVTSGASAVWHLYVIRTKKRDELKAYLAKKGIQTGIHYPIALPNLKAYQYLGHQPQDFPVASLNQDRMLSLPIYPEMTDEMVEYVTGCVREFFS